MITAYDYTSGLLCDKAGADILLVGDSVGMVVLGMETTVAVTMEYKNQFVYAFTHQSLFIHSISKHVSDYFSFLFISKSIHLSFSLFLMYPIYMLS